MVMAGLAQHHEVDFRQTRKTGQLQGHLLPVEGPKAFFQRRRGELGGNSLVILLIVVLSVMIYHEFVRRRLLVIADELKNVTPGALCNAGVAGRGEQFFTAG